MKNRVKFVRDTQKPNELKHYGVMGMKWGVRKESYYEPVGPISNKMYNLGKRGFFKKGVKDIKASSSSVSSIRNKGSSFVFQFNKTTFDKVKAWKKKKDSTKSSKTSTGTKAKAETALKEKIASSSKKSENANLNTNLNTNEKINNINNLESRSSENGIDYLNDYQNYLESNSFKNVKNNLNSFESYLKNIKKEQEEQEFQDENLVSLDPDFNEKYFTSENKIGNTDFYAYKNDNGIWIISDKEKKWMLPEGMEIDRNDFSEKLENFENALKEIIESTGYEFSEEELDMWRTAAINKIISELKTPQQETNERIAEVINNLLGEEDKEKNYEDESQKTKIGDNVSKVIEELEEKKKR